MNTKSFVQNLNQITTTLISMTPAQREVVHQSIRASQVEMPTNELFQPIFDTSSSCPHCTSTHLRKWGKSGETQRYRCNHCAKTFNIKTKTPLARLRKCHLWEEYAR
ncbi:IS1 family transposase, partial [Psychromonas arctica]|uniref:IS1 family transposase n=1 Tax=Psychromonas arctica TaxID=168275 RepID=UPI001B7FDB32